MSAYDLLNGFLFQASHHLPQLSTHMLRRAFHPSASGAGRGTHAAMIPPKPGGELKLPIGGRVSTTVTPSQSGGAPFRLPLRSAYPSQGKESANPVFSARHALITEKILGQLSTAHTTSKLNLFSRNLLTIASGCGNRQQSVRALAPPKRSGIKKITLAPDLASGNPARTTGTPRSLARESGKGVFGARNIPFDVLLKKCDSITRLRDCLSSL